MRDLLSVADLTADELEHLLALARRAKADRHAFRDAAAGASVAVLFEKPSLRTRFSVEVACTRVGAHPVGAYDREVGLGSREPIADAARVLDGYVDAIVMRTFEHDRVRSLADAAGVPVINALSDDHHPLQGLADVLTIEDTAPSPLRVAWIGDGNNVCHSLLEACALRGIEVVVACPSGHEPDGAVVSWAAERIAVDVTDDPVRAVKDSTAVVTDVWASMGREDEAEQRRATFEPYRVTPELMASAATGAVFLHCLPAHRGDEVAAEVIDGGASVVFEQAHNRLHTTTAVLAAAIGGA